VSAGFPDFGVVVAAAGAGKRFGAQKQFVELEGRPLLHYSLDVFADLAEVSEIVVVGPPGQLDAVSAVVGAWRAARSGSGGSSGGGPSFERKYHVVAGAARRQDSVRLGLEVFWNSRRWALVHDAARPLVSVDDVARLVEAVRLHGAAALGHPATDSLKEEGDGWVRRSLDRSRIWQVQTPQGASCDLFRQAYGALEDGLETSDEVELLSRFRIRVKLVQGRRDNVKLTAPEDVRLVAALLAGRREATR
jgi:2-C-methyl-D-erythritol 4-phosphate cytidylyltransferase